MSYDYPDVKFPHHAVVSRERQAEALRHRADLLEEEAAFASLLIERLGTNDDYSIDTVINFTRTFGGAKEYSYVAIKCSNSLWSVTGKLARQVSWEQLIEMHLQYCFKAGRPIFIATSWEEI